MSNEATAREMVMGTGGTPPEQQVWFGGSPGPVTIASVFPQECVYTVNWGARGGFTTYTLKAAPRDGVSIIKIYDTAQLLMNWGAREVRLAPIVAMEAAKSLVAQWSGFTLGSKYGRPGIWICKGEVPTEEEVLENRKIQEIFFRGLVQDATDYHNRGEAKNISDLHRRAAEWLLGTGASNLPWVPRMSFKELKPCPACGEEIKASALKCKECGTYLPDFYIQAKLGLPDNDPDVRAVLDRATSSVPPPKPVGMPFKPIEPKEVK